MLLSHFTEGDLITRQLNVATEKLAFFSEVHSSLVGDRISDCGPGYSGSIPGIKESSCTGILYTSRPLSLHCCVQLVLSISMPLIRLLKSSFQNYDRKLIDFSLKSNLIKTIME